MKIIIKYNDDYIKIKFLNNINYKIKSNLSKICDLVILEYKRKQNEIEELIENCNNIIEQIKDEKKKLKKWWRIKKSNEEIKLLEIPLFLACYWYKHFSHEQRCTIWDYPNNWYQPEG